MKKGRKYWKSELEVSYRYYRELLLKVSYKRKTEDSYFLIKQSHPWSKISFASLPIAKTEGIILKVNLTKLTSRSKLLVFLKHPRTYPGDILHSFSIRVPNCRDHYARLIRARRVRGIKQPSTSVPETLRKKRDIDEEREPPCQSIARTRYTLCNRVHRGEEIGWESKVSQRHEVQDTDDDTELPGEKGQP